MKTAEKLGIIKNESSVSEKMEVSFENLDAPIKAYEFMNLLYDALFIPFDKKEGGWASYTIYGYRYYEPFMNVKDVSEEYEAITD